MAGKEFYFDFLYPFQDQVLEILGTLDTNLYLTGGTAASRGYLQHRFSDDLDFFTNDDPEFRFSAERVIQALNASPRWDCQVLLKEDRFARLNLIQEKGTLKLELVNDVPAHAGQIRKHPVLGRLDSPENILANKLTAVIDREEPKDLADIWGFCCRLGLSIEDAIEGAQSKAAGIFPADLARVLLRAGRKDWELVRWIEPPEPSTFLADLHMLGERLLQLK
jgi:hypothetical protein